MKVAQFEDGPAAMPVGETDDTREKLIRDAGFEESLETEQLINSDETENVEPRGPSRKRKFIAAFALFAFGCVAFATLIAWFFGLGTFAPAVKQNIDRTAKTGTNEQTAPATDEEKLKMALNLVAEKSPTDLMPVVTEVQRNDAAQVPPISLPVTESSFENDPVAAAEVPTDQRPSAITAVSPKVLSSKTSLVAETDSPSKSPSDESYQITETRSEMRTTGRSVFFGAQIREKTAETPIVAVSATPTPVNSRVIPFGKLLPVRLLGALVTLRSSAALVRMELTQAVAGDTFSYPAGTVIIGQLRGSEGNRAFVSIVGLIDPVSGAFVKLEGELVGTDGASGINGRRRGGKSAWSRVLKGLRETGAAALGAIGGRSGGTVVFSDRTTGELRGELAGIVGPNRPSGEFVEVAAGTSGFVLVTGLPDEQAPQ